MNTLTFRPSTPALNTLQREVNRLFDAPWTPNGNTTRGWTPRADVSEYEDRFVLNFDLPGLSKKDVELNFHENTLEVKGERSVETDEEGRTFFRSERVGGEFSRTFRFRTRVDSTKIKATFKNGVLTVTVPKAEESKPRTIQIS